MKPNDVVSTLPNNPTPSNNASVAAQQEQQPGLDFVRQVITEDLAEGRTQKSSHAFPARAEWLFTYWSRESDLLKLWYCQRV